MYARFILFAAATLVSMSASAADAPKAPVQPATQQQQSRSGPVVLASADDLRTPTASDDQAPTPPKHRIARVTTCRCGDIAGEAQPEQ